MSKIAINNIAHSLKFSRLILSGTCDVGEEVKVTVDDLNVTALSRTRDGYWSCTMRKYGNNRSRAIKISTSDDALSVQHQFTTITLPLELDIDDFVYDPVAGTVTAIGSSMSAPWMGSHWNVGRGDLARCIRDRAERLTAWPHRTVPDLCELGIVANATGLKPDRPGLHAPIARTLELPELMRPSVDGGLFEGEGVVEGSLVSRCDRAEEVFDLCLIFAKIFSIGLRSGLYGGRYTTLAPACSIRATARGDLWLGRLSITTRSPSRSAGANSQSTNVSKTAAFVGPSVIIAARVPLTSIACSKVVVRQRRCGTGSVTRSARRPQP